VVIEVSVDRFLVQEMVYGELISKLSLALFLRLLTLSFVAFLAHLPAGEAGIPSGYALRKAPWLNPKFLKNHSYIILR